MSSNSKPFGKQHSFFHGIIKPAFLFIPRDAAGMRLTQAHLPVIKNTTLHMLFKPADALQNTSGIKGNWVVVVGMKYLMGGRKSYVAIFSRA